MPGPSPPAEPCIAPAALSSGLSPRMWSLVPLWLALSGAVTPLQCPDGRLCQGLDGCCRDPGGDGYACCPPSLGSSHSVPMTQASSVDKPAGTVCPDGTRCPVEHSCLRTSAGSFSCCPLSEAVACADRHHCCPRGSHCSADGKSCFVFPGLPAADAVQCPDGESECPNESTCCMMPTGSWGCCPMPQAACCVDKVHCCPHATTCDLEHARCLSAAGEQPLGSKVPARKRAPWQGVPASFIMITCPDHQSACPDGTTCCQLPTSQYGCCYLQNAVCCQDHVHCCPKGHTCDPAGGSCRPPAAPVPWLEKTPVRVRAPSAGRDVQCDEQTSCPEGNTCCRLATGGWGCCPLEEAVCCQDHVHCCPKGHTCDPVGGSCLPPAAPVPWLEKTPVRVQVPSAGRDVQCDEQTSCPEGNTCCRLATGEWGCCPLEEAVCCQDHVHCCPKGHICDPTGGSCHPPAAPVPWLEKTPARVRAPSAGRDVQCDEQTSCPEGNTCCRLATGDWGCCPLPEAVCCQDHIHCCPKGHTCDPVGGSCQQALLSVPWAPKAPAHVPGATQSRGVKCNQTVSCEDGQTCCKSETGTWACCHLPNAVCCEDHQHCCPGGYTCNLATQSCEKQQAGRVLPGDLSLVAPLLPASPEPSNKVTCDAQHYCRTHQTCCKAASGTWACCPYFMGFCCPDQRHCCPWGYRCSRSSLDCKRRWLPRWDAGAPRLL
ncbi:progranulin isoform X1 [Natator depressus]|uniref:progranulin isoform X1 n=2 Tax=Natator depressus TaxID=27790 RepID=UPI003EB9C8B3